MVTRPGGLAGQQAPHSHLDNFPSDLNTATHDSCAGSTFMTPPGSNRFTVVAGAAGVTVTGTATHDSCAGSTL